MLEAYRWCVVVGGIACFTMGFGIGSNDVSNNFGTSVGSKSISLGKALIIAAIFELIGSVLLGASVTDAIRKGVYDPSAFGDIPELLLLANLCALICGTVWLLTASTLGLSVSTTHSLVGAMLGTGLALSTSAVNWWFIGQVILSWIIAPFISIVIGALYFVGLRAWILRSPQSVERGHRYLWLLMVLLGVVFALFFTFSNPITLDGRSCYGETPCKVSKWVENNIGIGFGIGIGGGIVIGALLSPLVYWAVRRQMRKYDAIIPATMSIADLEDSMETSAATPEKSKIRSMWDNMPWKADLHAEAFEHSAKAAEMSVLAEQFDPRTENFFKVLQLVSASVACLVHGANDVSNATAPFASIVSIYEHGEFLKHVEVHTWILLLGGCAISVGLCFLGHRVIKRVGIELIFISPSRGFVVEMALATVMVVASFMGISLSTTHVAVGAMIGVGLMDRQYDSDGNDLGRRRFGLNFGAINWRTVGIIGCAWVGTLILTAGFSAALYSFVIYSPTKVTSRFMFIGNLPVE